MQNVQSCGSPGTSLKTTAVEQGFAEWDKEDRIMSLGCS